MSSDTESVRGAIPQAPGLATQAAGDSRQLSPVFTRTAMLVPAALAALLGFWQISSLSFTQDEAATLAAVRRPFGSMLAMLEHIDAVHGAYYLIMHLVAQLGTSEAVMRTPSVLAMAGTAWLTAAIGTRLSGLKVGLVAGLLLAALPFSTEYAQDARPFALATFLAAASYYTFVGFLRSGTRRAGLWYGIALAAAGLTNVFTLLIVAAQLVTLAPSPVRRDRWRLFVVALTAAALVMLPVGWLAATEVSQVGWERRPSMLLVGSILAVLVLAGLGLWAVASRGSPGRSARTEAAATLGTAPLVRLSAAWLILPVAILVSTSQIPVPSNGGLTAQATSGTGIWEPRYLLFCLPALALLLAEMMSRLPSRLTTWTMLGSLAVVMAGQVAIRPPVSSDDLRGASSVLRIQSRPGDAVLFPDIAKRLIKDAYPLGFERVRDIGLDRSPGASDSLYGLNVSSSVLWQRLDGPRGPKRLWVIIFPVSSPSRHYGQPGARPEFCLKRAWQVPLNMILLYDRC